MTKNLNDTMVKSVGLSRQTIRRQQQKLALQIKERLISDLSGDKLIWYSIAVDESLDVASYAQLIFFIRFVTKDFEIREEFLCMKPLKDKATGVNIYELFVQVIKEFSLDPMKLAAVCTDGGTAMAGKERGLVTLLRSSGKFTNFLYLKCIIHQQALCAKACIFMNTMKEAVDIVNYIRGSSVNHIQFKEKLIECDDVAYITVPYYSSIRWLSNGRLLTRVLEFRKPIIEFYEAKEMKCVLADEEFHISLMCINDMVENQQRLNLELQGNQKNVYQVYVAVTEFLTTLKLVKKNVECGKLTKLFFITLAEKYMFKDLPERIKEELKTALNLMIEAYENLFIDFGTELSNMQLVFSPFDINPEDVDDELSLELISVQADVRNKYRFSSEIPISEVWRNINGVPKLRILAAKYLACFSPAHCCEKAFSDMKNIKRSNRMISTNENLDDEMRIKLNKMTLNYEE
ncbi:GT2D2 [Enterospora canceri]|uniref:GT2D2 n=1 Tax=Enterospora canceri TaxID=1081671 RepID=A0A1Y1S929_9MICR|nr:GT2D2 [Enterospora canceri]